MTPNPWPSLLYEAKEKSDVAVLLGYAGSHKGLTFLGLGLSAVSMLLSMAPYICIWLAVRDLIAAAPDWTEARSIARYGWMAFAFAVAGILLYFAGLMCTHLAAFRTAANIRKQGVAHVMKAPLGFSACRKSATLQGEPISARMRGTEIPSPWYPPGDKIWRRTAHSPRGGSHALSAKFPCMCPVHPLMSAGRTFLTVWKAPLGFFDDTVMENIRLGRRGATDEEVRAAAEAANCGELIRRLPRSSFLWGGILHGCFCRRPWALIPP